MTVANDIVAPRRRGLSGPKVAMILTGFFLTVTAVDVVMITSALDSQSGLVTEHSYERGLAFNDLLAREARQEKLGWKLSVVQMAGRLSVAITDDKGQSVAVDRLELRLVRSSDARLDRTLAPVPAAGGRFEAELAGAPAGLWQVAVTAFRGEDRFDRVDTLVIP